MRELTLGSPSQIRLNRSLSPHRLLEYVPGTRELIISLVTDDPSFANSNQWLWALCAKSPRLFPSSLGFPILSFAQTASVSTTVSHGFSHGSWTPMDLLPRLS
jgi:hypothetical protein